MTKTQLLRYFEALHAKNSDLNKSESKPNAEEEPENWELVAEIHGDKEAPGRFQDYVEVLPPTQFYCIAICL